MSAEFTQEEWQITVNFLKEFTSEHPYPSENEDNLPFRATPRTVRNEELSGCLIEWTLECLRKCNCPEVLATIITYQATKDILDSNLSSYKHEDSEELEMEKVARATFSNIQKLCSKWNQETPKLYKSKRSYPSCAHAIKNTRRKMEDKHVILPDFNSLFGLNKGYPDLAFFAVYDGHAGVDAAIFSATHLHCFLANNENLSTDPGLALHESLMAIDDAFGEKAKAEGLRSGCTAVTVLISDDKMFIAWLGDSQVVLCKGGEYVSLMEPHKPDNKEERERIEALGGCVVYFGAWRVNGSLSVSRAIGDIEHKPYISGEPFVAEYCFDGDEEFLVLACDGLWDTIGKDQAIEIVRNHLSQGNDRETVAKLLVDAAKTAGSSDNISVIVVYLDAHNIKSNHSMSLTNKEEVNSSSSHNNSSHNKLLANKEDVKSPSNGDITNTSKTNSLGESDKENCHVDGTRVHIVEKEESHESIVAKVKVSTESKKASKTKSVTCRVTNEKHDSCRNGACSSELTQERTSKSAGNSPKHTRNKPVKSKGSSQHSKGVKAKSPHQLSVGSDASTRRKSAPAEFSLS